MTTCQSCRRRVSDPRGSCRRWHRRRAAGERRAKIRSRPRQRLSSLRRGWEGATIALAQLGEVHQMELWRRGTNRSVPRAPTANAGDRLVLRPCEKLIEPNGQRFGKVRRQELRRPCRQGRGRGEARRLAARRSGTRTKLGERRSGLPVVDAHRDEDNGFRPVMAWTSQPARKNGRPVKVRTILPVAILLSAQFERPVGDGASHAIQE